MMPTRGTPFCLPLKALTLWRPAEGPGVAPRVCTAGPYKEAWGSAKLGPGPGVPPVPKGSGGFWAETPRKG